MSQPHRAMSVQSYTNITYLCWRAVEHHSNKPTDTTVNNFLNCYFIDNTVIYLLTYLLIECGTSCMMRRSLTATILLVRTNSVSLTTRSRERTTTSRVWWPRLTETCSRKLWQVCLHGLRYIYIALNNAHLQSSTCSSQPLFFIVAIHFTIPEVT